MSPLKSIHSILVLCEGNHCRSPLAEALLRAALGSSTQVQSAGLAALHGQPAHDETLAILQEQGLDHSDHRGRQLTPDLAHKADLILVMDRSQKDACERMVPSARGRVFLLGHWLPATDQEIADPIRRGPEAHRRAHEHIKRALKAWLPRLEPRFPGRQ